MGLGLRLQVLGALAAAGERAARACYAAALFVLDTLGTPGGLLGALRFGARSWIAERLILQAARAAEHDLPVLDVQLAPGLRRRGVPDPFNEHPEGD